MNAACGNFDNFGALAQLGERLLCKHQVIGSIPIGSTTSRVILEMKTRDHRVRAVCWAVRRPSLTL